MQAIFGAAMGEQMHVECPICQAKVLASEINSHIDLMHLEASPAEPARERLADESGKRQVAQGTGTDKRQRTSCASAGGDNCAANPSGPGSCPSTYALGNLDTGVTVHADTGVTVHADDTVCQTSIQESDCRPESPPPCTQTLAGAKALPGAPAASSSDLLASLPPEEHLKAFLLGSRTHALRCARDDSERMHAKVSQLYGEVQQAIEQRRQDFEKYPVMTKPTYRDQQLARNAMRSDLEDVARTARCNVNFLITSSCEPEEALLTMEAAQLEKFDRVLNMLEKLRAETVEEFQKCKEEEARKRESREASALALGPSLDCLDCFVRHLAQEVHDETTKAIHVHTEKLEELQREQARFVNANDSPQRNPIFAKVIDDLASTKRALEEHSLQSASYKDLLKDWEDILERMPTNKQAAPIPEKRTFLDGVYGIFGRS